MRALTNPQIVDIWERGTRLGPVERAVLMLAAATGRTAEDLSSLAIGARDAMLLDVREHTFGPSLDACAPCRSCGTPLEAAFTCADIRVRELPGHDSTAVVEFAGEPVEFRLVTSRDLVRVSNERDADEAARSLAALCVMRSTSPASSLVRQPAFLSALSERIASCDPQADVQLTLVCASCGDTSLTDFDIAAYLWAEIGARARALLVDIHNLASAYSWREADILALSDTRRAAYIELLG